VGGPALNGAPAALGGVPRTQEKLANERDTSLGKARRLTSAVYLAASSRITEAEQN